MRNDTLSYLFPVTGFCGIGVEIGPAQQGIAISLMPSPFQTPAQRAGLQEGDIITHFRMGDQPWTPMPTDVPTASSIIRGMQGSPIELRLSRPSTGTTYETSLIREAIFPVRNADSAMEIYFIPEANAECEPLAQHFSKPPTGSLAMSR